MADFGGLLLQSVSSLSQFNRATRDATNALIDSQQHRSMFSPTMTAADMQAEARAMRREARVAHMTGDSYARLRASESRLNESTALPEAAATRIKNDLSAFFNNARAWMNETLLAIPGITALLKEIAGKSGDEEAKGPVDRYLDYLVKIKDEIKPKERKL